MRFSPRLTQIVAAAALVAAGGCGNHASMLPSQIMGSTTQPAQSSPDNSYSILKVLTRERTIGSTVDPELHQLNPYGLTVAPSTNGVFTKGDLVVCNFNASNNVRHRLYDRSAPSKRGREAHVGVP